MEAGKVGVECRGYEHEVNLVWSIASGKRSITEDGKNVHSSQGRRGEGRFHHSWVGRNNHVFTVIAHASPPLKPDPKFRQFELLIDGMALTSFPRIFELAKGVTTSNYARTGVVSSRRVTASVPRSEYRSDRESLRSMSGEDMQWARHTSVRPSTMSRTAVTSNISTEVPSSPEEEQQQQQPPDLLSSPPVSLVDIDYSSSQEQVSSLWDSENSFPSLPNQSGYNPAQPPSYEQVHSSIMGAYGTNIYMNNDIITTQTSTEMPDMNKLNIHTDFPSENMKDNKESLSVESPRDVTDIDGVLQNLVNLDDISSPVYQGYSEKETAKLVKMERSKKSLSELKNMVNGANSRPNREIMKTHQDYSAANPGALVVYGQEQQGYNAYACNTTPLYGSSYGY